MRSTHYPIELARIYDMTQIEERVRLRGQVWADEDSAGNVGPGAERFDVLRVVGPALSENR